MFSIGQIAKAVDGSIHGDPGLMIYGICSIDDGKKGCISFLRSSRYNRFFHNSKAAAVIVGNSFNLERREKTVVTVENPDIAFITVLSMFDKKTVPSPGIHASAVIGENTSIGTGCMVQPHAVIGENVTIGNDTFIGANVSIGNGCSVGNRSVLHPNVTVYHSCFIGDDVTIDSGSVIGADGFGWVTVKDVHHKIPQIGKVIIRNNVWIGANCNVDRGTFRDTIINENTKLDNGIQIGHNVEIGRGCLFAGQVGIAGSTKIGNFVTLAGQVGVVDHISIGDRSIVASKTGVFQSLPPGSFVSGTPARPHFEKKRQDVIIGKLPEIARRLRALENRFDELSKGKN